MHPAIARFIDLQQTLAAFDKADRHASLDADEAALSLVASQEPTLVRAIRSARGTQRASPEVQAQLIVLATKAATEQLTHDATLGPLLRAAISGLLHHGASQEEALNLVTQAVLEEAFDSSEDPSHFDADFLTETWAHLPRLGTLTKEVVEDWVDSFVALGAAEQRPLRLRAAETLLAAAWGEGPQPIASEHLDEALLEMSNEASRADALRAGAILGEFLGFLAEKELLGPSRLNRLNQLLAASQGFPETSDDWDDDDDEEADDEDDDDDDESPLRS